MLLGFYLSVLCAYGLLKQLTRFFFSEEKYLMGTGTDIWLGVPRAASGESFLNYGLCDEDCVTS